jgi:hypothetical protein
VVVIGKHLLNVKESFLHTGGFLRLFYKKTQKTAKIKTLNNLKMCGVNIINKDYWPDYLLFFSNCGFQAGIFLTNTNAFLAFCCRAAGCFGYSFTLGVYDKLRSPKKDNLFYFAAGCYRYGRWSAGKNTWSFKSRGNPVNGRERSSVCLAWYELWVELFLAAIL